jgi:hypothetical protein
VLIGGAADICGEPDGVDAQPTRQKQPQITQITPIFLIFL